MTHLVNAKFTACGVAKGRRRWGAAVTFLGASSLLSSAHCHLNLRQATDANSICSSPMVYLTAMGGPGHGRAYQPVSSYVPDLTTTRVRNRPLGPTTSARAATLRRLRHRGWPSIDEMPGELVRRDACHPASDFSAAQIKSTSNSLFVAMLVQTRVRAKRSCSWQAIPQAGSSHYTTHVRAGRLGPTLDRLVR